MGDARADEPLRAADDVEAGPRTGPTVKAEVDGVKDAQTAASNRVFPLAPFLLLLPLMRPADLDCFEEGIVLGVLFLSS